MKRRISCLIPAAVTALLLSSCTQTQPAWHWENPQNPTSPNLYRDLDDCRFYAGITTTQAFGADRPVDVAEWDEGVQECMAKRGWTFVAPDRKTTPVSPRQSP